MPLPLLSRSFPAHSQNPEPFFQANNCYEEDVPGHQKGNVQNGQRNYG